MNVTCVIQSPEVTRETHVTFVLAMVTVMNTLVHLAIKLVRMALKQRKPALSSVIEIASRE